MDTETSDQSRRGFLRGALFTEEGRRQQAQVQQRQGVMPPGLQAVVAAVNCGDCSRPCVDACEQEIIRIHDEKHELCGQPYLNFSSTGCTFCGDCAQACPASDQGPGPGADAIGQAQLDQSSCLSWNQVFCMSCVGSCTSKALNFDARRRLLIKPQQCNGCGMCVGICPVGSLAVV
ncbi:MAG: 4Fe-4S dicluster domain-containing protein [Gammaproteobacteria bacterium]|nr:4Fe-4S dicluster domain-containing protein [Gammaproteobacteria bacterium]